MTFTDVTTEVQDALARTDSVVTLKIPTWVNRRQTIAAQRYNFGFMRSDPPSSVSVTTAAQSYALPTDFKGDVAFYLLETNAFTMLELKPETAMLRRFLPTDVGKPQFVTLRDGNLLIWPPKSDAAYTLKVLYWKWPADLSGTQTNWFTTYAPRMLIAGGLAEGYAFLGAPEDAVYWEQQFETWVNRAIEADGEKAAPTEDLFRQMGIGWDLRGGLIGGTLTGQPDPEDRT